MNGPTYDTNKVSGAVFTMYRCLLDLGYKVKSCKKTGNYFRILLTPKDAADFSKDRLIRLYPQGSFRRTG